jgi:plastocyanin
MFVVPGSAAARFALLVMSALLVALVLVPASQAATRTVVVGPDGDEEIDVPSTVEQGDTVVFSFQDGGHDLSMGGPGGESAVIGEQDEGFSFRRVLNRPGDYALVCQEHDDDGMNATFTVDAVPGGPDPATLPPPARDVVVGGDGDDGKIDPSSVTLFQGAELLFHFAESGSIRFSDGTSTGTQARNTTYARVMNTLGTFTFTSGSDSGSVTVQENTGSGIRPVPVDTPASATVRVGSGTSYSPANVTIDEGGVVRWDWAGGTHNVQFDDGTGSPFQSSGSFAAKFYVPSTLPYRFVCTAHPGMEGSVTVRDTGTPGPNEQPPGKEPPPDPGDGGEDPGGGDPGGEDPGGEDPGGEPPVAEVTGGVGGNVFSPADVAIVTGQAVRWTWTNVHNVQFADGTGSATVANGTFTRRFLEPGLYEYACSLHDGMEGTVTATGAPVPDDGTGTPDDGTGLPDDGTDTTDDGNGTTDDGTDTTTGTDRDAGAAGSTGSSDGGTAVFAAPAGSASTDAGPDRTRPRLGSLRAVLRAGRRASRLLITVDEDVRIDLTLRAIGRSRDANRTRRLRLFARRGTHTLTLPKMTLTAARYSVTVRVVDQAGNRSASSTMTVRRTR